MQYIRHLEQKIRQLEDEKRAMLPHNSTQKSDISDLPNHGNFTATSFASIRPEAVVKALQVLEVREQLERHDQRPFSSRESTNPPTNANHTPNDSNGNKEMDESEKALVREMCNVCNFFFIFKKKIYYKVSILARFLPPTYCSHFVTKITKLIKFCKKNFSSSSREITS